VNGMNMIPKARPHFGQEELAFVEEAMASGWVSNGPMVREFESQLAHYLGLERSQVIAVTNCTSALHVALLSLGIGPRDEVLVSDFTFPATGHAVMYCGATPRFVDVDKDTYNMNWKLMEGMINERTKAIIPVHTFGQPADMDEIMGIAEDHSIPVIEDSACALGSKLHGKQMAGTIGDFGCYSLHALKGITCGEGGVLLVHRDHDSTLARRYCNYGIESAISREGRSDMTPTFNILGYNYKMSDILAGVALGQLARIDRYLERRGEIAMLYDSLLKDSSEVSIPVDGSGGHIYQSYVVTLSEGILRNRLIKVLNEDHGIGTTLGTYSCSLQPVYRSRDKCPISGFLSEHTLALPIYYEMTDDDVSRVAYHLELAIEEVSS